MVLVGVDTKEVRIFSEGWIIRWRGLIIVKAIRLEKGKFMDWSQFWINCN